MSTATPEQAGYSHAPGLWRWVAAGVVVVAAAAAVAVTGPFTGPGSPGTGPAGSTYPTSTATVTRRSLVSQTQVAATLGYAATYTVVNQAHGTLTMLPAVGRVVRQGRVLYRVSGRPVVLLYGPVPAYRDLSYGMTGRDVAELNAALVALGCATRAQLNPHSDYFSLETTYALEELQSRLGVTRTGELALGRAVFLPAAARITALGAATVLGGPVQPGAALLSASSTTPVITVNLDAAQQTEVKAGDRVTITLPGGQTTPGTVSSVGTVATTPSPGVSGSTPTITVEVTPADPKAAGGLDQAPVQVSITTGSVNDALVVPVSALLAQPGGGYAVEVTGTRGNHLVAVSPGMFDDADGLVQVTGPGLAAGQHVVVPTA
ncbi:MAG: Peptidoglycan-binding domain 1 protein [Actinomycetia bacterium]|nr:Peptidoglycan-binding domain 1 protein [Actinomycetes bacterium]